jgi:hypothetical protein
MADQPTAGFSWASHMIFDLGLLISLEIRA